jgi:hypothetical protein
LGLEVIEEVRPVQRPDGEVPGAELVLGEQRAKDESGVIAAREGFRVIDLGKHPAAGLRDTGVGSPRSGGSAGNACVLPQGEPDGVAQRERLLWPKGRGEQ